MFDAKIAEFSVHVLLQSTVLITIGLLAIYLCGRQKSAVQSVILRVTLVAVLFCPLVSLTLSKIGVTSYALLPSWETQQTVQSDNVSRPPMSRSLPLEKMPFNSNTESDEMAETSQFPKTDFPETSVLPVNQSETGIADPSVAGVQPIPHSGKSARFLSFTGWFVSFTWITGIGFLLFRLFRANRQITRLCQNSQPADAEIQTLCRETSATLGLNPPEVKLSPSVHSPCLIGIWKPVIILPEQKTLTQPVLRDVFLHELAHLARRDCLFHLLARLTTAVLFFQPLVWRLTRRLELIADDLCDDYVIQYGSGRKSYANTLVDFAEQLPAPQLAMEAGLAMVSLRSSLSRRIMRIMDTSRSLTLRLSAKWVVLITLLGISATTSAALMVNTRSTSVVKNETGNEATQPPPVRSVAPAVKATPQTRAQNTTKVTAPDTGSKKKAAATPKSEFRFQGRVVDPNGKPVKQASINYTRWDMPHKQILATTNEQGTFSFTIAPSHQLYEMLQEGGMFVVLADGYGPAMKNAHDCEASGEMRNALLARNSNSQAP
ncbi:MAG: hypothetical protein KDA77_06665, partial [Planctomycetaceae bacterium]|nr:hypothetical protein [Planctomycetaceae bacterium]